MDQPPKLGSSMGPNFHHHLLWAGSVCLFPCHACRWVRHDVPVSLTLLPNPLGAAPFSFLAMPAGGCATDCPVPYTSCPTPSGSLSMCGGPPRGICSTATGACSCNTGYSGSDCSSCAAGYTRQGTRCITTGGAAAGSLRAPQPASADPQGSAAAVVCPGHLAVHHCWQHAVSSHCFKVDHVFVAMPHDRACQPLSLCHAPAS